jgi:hypothetical protein
VIQMDEKKLIKMFGEESAAIIVDWISDMEKKSEQYLPNKTPNGG